MVEENWFFRLSRYQERLSELLAGGGLRVEPEARRNEVLAFVAGGLEDFSVSRSRVRARGWGIPVPGDPTQVVYVWWDALGNYLTALDHGTGGAAYDRWWRGGGRRVHLIGKGILRFHAVYWPAMLLSAGEPLPTHVLVHDHLTVEGHKLSKSSGNVVDPVALVERFGADAVRWWLLREVPRVGDTDFTVARLVARANADLVGGFGNLVNRVVGMVHRFRGGEPPAVRQAAPGAERLARTCELVPRRVDESLAEGDFRGAAAAVWSIVDEANRYVEAARPWRLAGDGVTGRLDAVLGVLLDACRALAGELAPLLPDAAARIAAQCAASEHGLLPPAKPLLTRITDAENAVLSGAVRRRASGAARR